MFVHARRCLIALVLSAAPAAAQQDTFTTSGGVRVPTPAEAGLDCAAMAQVLTAIDSSGYRGVAPGPGAAADASLRAYEDRVSRRWFSDCVNGPGALAEAESAFSHGFGADGEPAARP